MNQEIKRGEVWYNRPKYTPTGHIQAGPRPVIIVSNDICNTYSSVVLAVPCTTARKKDMPNHVHFLVGGRINTALTEQVMPVNKSELTNYKYTMSEEDMRRIDLALSISLSLPSVPLPKPKKKRRITSIIWRWGKWR